MIFLIGNDDEGLSNIRKILSRQHPNEKTKRFLPSCLDQPYEKNGALPTRLSFVGHTFGMHDATFAGLSPKQFVARLMSVLKMAALVDPGIKHSIKDIDIISCGLGYINPKTGQSYAVEVVNLLAVELEKEKFKPIQLKTFTNLMGEGEQNFVQEISMKIENDTFTLFGVDRVANAYKLDEFKKEILDLSDSREILRTKRVETKSILDEAKQMLMLSAKELKLKPTNANQKEHDSLVLAYENLSKKLKEITKNIDKLDKKIGVLCENLLVFKEKHEKIFLTTQDIREAFDSEPAFNINNVAEDIAKILKKPVNTVSSINQRNTFFHSTGERKPEPENVTNNHVNPNRYNDLK